ncbi:MAG: ATP-dependent DNA helicase [Mariprofundaceae bacterium]|nr:ATP-dependent DNA helicase [Mariprofundaceae bacterium]
MPSQNDHELSQQVSTDFAKASPLTTGLDNYAYRKEQVLLAEGIANTMEQGSILLAEAETGTGKTLAYLVPALRSSNSILISTHTRSLQDQLMFRDIPAVQKALGIRRKIALLKGRSNYYCPQRLNMHIASPQQEIWAKKNLLKVAKWAEDTVDGDLSALAFDVFEKGIGQLVTATAEQCTGSKCEHYKQCPLMKARQKAQNADIVVANHSLLLADASLKSGDFGEVLPVFDTYILDEAHSLPDLASRHFGIQLSRNRLIYWLNDIQSLLDTLGDEPDLKEQIRTLGAELLKQWGLQPLPELKTIWDELHGLCISREERHDDMLKLSERAMLVSQEMQQLIQPQDGFVVWHEGEKEYTRHLCAPVETGPVLNEHLWEREASFILLSATLRVSNCFDYARNRLGLSPELAQESFHPSPFDYAQQAMLYLPQHIPEPRHPDYQNVMQNEIEALLRTSRGRAFVLFTSHYALRNYAQHLQTALPWQVLIQGESGSRDAILEAFRQDKHSILCGTRSFWEGVDVPGETLSLVIIDKIPFAPPNDVLLQERVKHCQAQGGNGFMDIQLAEAIAVLRQGAGRLIRSTSDRGAIAILDSRLHHKRYGKEIIRNLPQAPIAHDLGDMRWFFEDET